MTQSEKISILVNKYGSKSILMDFDSSSAVSENSFSPPFILPDQLYVDLQNLPLGKNPLISSPVNLAEWPNTGSAVIRKIIKKKLTWIRGTYAFYDADPATQESALVDVISPRQHISFAPEVYLLNSKSNEYNLRISPSECPWSFDYETGCLVFLDGFPSRMKSPQFQPPAITAYRYIGSKSAYGLSPDRTIGPTGPTGPMGETGDLETESMIWTGSYGTTNSYSLNDVVENDGIFYVKKSGATGPTTLNPTYFDSVTYNELDEGFIQSYCEQYFDSSFSIGSPPYFQTLDDFSSELNVDLKPGDFFYKYKNCDQTLHVFNSGTSMYYYVDIPRPYSSRMIFYSNEKMTSAAHYGMITGGNRLFAIDGLYTDNTIIESTCSLELDNIKLKQQVTAYTVSFLGDPYGIEFDAKDVSFKTTTSYYQDSQMHMYGKSHIDATSFWNCSLKLGDQAMNSGAITTLEYRDRVVHLFTDCELIDTEITLDYSGRYSNVEIVFDRCSFVDSRQSVLTSGISFPVRPYEFSLSNQYRYRPKITVINSTFTCKNGFFNVPDYSDITTYGSCVMPGAYAPFVDARFTRIGTTTVNPMLSEFLESQTTFSAINPRQNSCFYFNL